MLQHKLVLYPHRCYKTLQDKVKHVLYPNIAFEFRSEVENRSYLQLAYTQTWSSLHMTTLNSLNNITASEYLAPHCSLHSLPQALVHPFASGPKWQAGEEKPSYWLCNSALLGLLAYSTDQQAQTLCGFVSACEESLAPRLGERGEMICDKPRKSDL